MRSSERPSAAPVPVSKDVKDLIRASNLLTDRSRVLQRAAATASSRLHDLLRRNIEVCGK